MVTFKFYKGKYPKKYKVEVYRSGKKIKTTQFGDQRYGQYQDKTPLKLYKEKDTLDKERRRLYRESSATRSALRVSVDPAPASILRSASIAAACAELPEARNARVSSVLGTGTEAATGVLKGTRRRTSLLEPPWLMH